MRQTGATFGCTIVSHLARVGSDPPSARFKAKAGVVYRIAVDGAGDASGTLALSWHP